MSESIAADARAGRCLWGWPVGGVVLVVLWVVVGFVAPVAAEQDGSEGGDAADREQAPQPVAEEAADAADAPEGVAVEPNAEGAATPADELSPIFRSVSPAHDLSAAVPDPAAVLPQAPAAPEAPAPTSADEAAEADDDDSPAYRSYTIREGDTFSSIARRVFGDEARWTAIAEANPLVDPARLRVGQTIRVPDPERYEAERERQLARVAAAVRRVNDGTDADEAADDGRTVTVTSGDTLSHIAGRVYGRSAAWRLIFDANRDQLDEPDDLEVGMTLTLPPESADEN